ncbi:MAG: hypothetical protein WD896_02470, partial [Parcubacteria group bacterium]
MSIPEVVSYDKDGRIEARDWRTTLFPRFFLSIIIILVASLSFGIGRLSVVGNREPIKIEYDPVLAGEGPQSQGNISQTASVLNAAGKLAPPSEGGVVVSKNGARYHYPHCSGAKQIKEENRIVFKTPAAAEAAGYTLAANCKP